MDITWDEMDALAKDAYDDALAAVCDAYDLAKDLIPVAIDAYADAVIGDGPIVDALSMAETLADARWHFLERLRAKAAYEELLCEVQTAQLSAGEREQLASLSESL